MMSKMEKDRLLSAVKYVIGSFPKTCSTVIFYGKEDLSLSYDDMTNSIVLLGIKFPVVTKIDSPIPIKVFDFGSMANNIEHWLDINYQKIV